MESREGAILSRGFLRRLCRLLALRRGLYRRHCLGGGIVVAVLFLLRLGLGLAGRRRRGGDEQLAVRVALVVKRNHVALLGARRLGGCLAGSLSIAATFLLPL